MHFAGGTMLVQTQLQTLSSEIFRRRRRAALDHAGLSRLIGFEASTIKRIEDGKGSVDTAKAILRAIKSAKLKQYAHKKGHKHWESPKIRSEFVGMDA